MAILQHIKIIHHWVFCLLFISALSKCSSVDSNACGSNSISFPCSSTIDEATLSDGDKRLTSSYPLNIDVSMPQFSLASLCSATCVGFRSGDEGEANNENQSISLPNSIGEFVSPLVVESSSTTIVSRQLGNFSSIKKEQN